MKEYAFTFHGKAKPKQSANFWKGRAVPKKGVKEFEESMVLQALKNKPPKPLEGAIKLTVQIFRAIPKSFNKRKTEWAGLGYIRPITRPDLDNCIKPIKDALNGLYWKDDSQVVSYGASTGKYYTNGAERIDVYVSELDDVTKTTPQ